MYIMEEYDNALEKILKNGVKKSSRAGDTLSIFGMQTRYRIDKKFPLLTKRKVFPKAIFAELLWMLSGSSNVNDLEALGSKIWTPWRDKKFEEKNGYVDGDLGPIYGHQLRFFGGDYEKCQQLVSMSETDRAIFLSKKNPESRKKYGYDQISYMLHELKNNKYSRRILFSMWNPEDMNSDRVKLASCHYTFQLFVDGNDRLSGMLTQRSADYPVGVCANVQFYSALIYMFAQQANLEPYELIHSTADSHIYSNQIESVEEYLSRPSPDSPTMKLVQSNSMFDYKLDNFVIENYNPQPVIKIPVSV